MITKVPEASQAKYFLCTLSTRLARKIVAYYNRELTSLGITAHQLMAMGILLYSESMSLGEFAERMMIRKPPAVYMIKRLEAMGLVTNERHPHDKRLNILKVTDKAIEMQPEIRKITVGLEKTLESQIGVSNLENLVGELSRILDLDF